MSPVDQSAGRHWGGRGEPTGAWTCPTCGAKNAGPVGDGCGGCGAGSAAKNAEAAARVQATVTPPVTVDEMRDAVYHPNGELTDAARTTVGRALEFYLAQGDIRDDGLSMGVIRAWVLDLIEDETTT